MLEAFCFTLVIVAMAFPGLILMLSREAASEAERQEQTSFRRRHV